MTVVEDPPSESLQETPTLAEPSTSDDATNAEPAEKWTIAATVLKLKLGHVISGAAIGLGIAVAATAFAGAPWHVMVTLFVVGCFVTPLQAAISTLLQTSVDNALLGRVQSAMNTTIGAANLISMACAGLLGALLGVRNVFILAGVVSVLAGLLAVRLFRATPSDH